MQTLTLNRQALLALIVATAFPLSALAGVGNVEFTAGTVNAQSADGATRVLSKGSEVNIGDTLKTLSGRMQVKFSDGGYISLQPNTEFTIDEYNYTGNKDSKEKGIFKLVKGGLRAITGAIGKTDKENYKVNTPTATIGIRGTEYVALQQGDRLLVKVGAGAVVVQNDAGNLVLYQGQSGEVNGPSSPPQQSTETPSVTAAAPAGNSVTETTEDSSTDSIYVDGNVRLDDTTLCQTGSGDCTAATVDAALNNNVEVSLINANLLLNGGLANIPLLGQINASALYVASLPNTIAFAGGSADILEKLLVSFYVPAVKFSVESVNTISGGTYSGQFLQAFAAGGLNSDGTFALQAVSGDVSPSPMMPGTSVSLNGSGALNPTTLNKATVNYTLSDASNNTLATVNNLQLDNGVAFIDSPGLLIVAQGGLVNLPTLHDLQASADYRSTSMVSLSSYTGLVNEVLTVDFAAYDAIFNVSDANTQGSTFDASASGTINSSSGVISLSQTSVGSPGATLVVNSASLNPSNLSQANINYTISDSASTPIVIDKQLVPGQLYNPLNP